MNAAGQTLPTGPLTTSQTVAAQVGRLPWYCYVIVFGAACVPIGVIWDISWHLSIGRDTFWTPAHAMVYLGGALPGCLCGWLVLKHTFRPDPDERAATVRLWGFRGPIGAWVVTWGAFAMLVSAPFDNWWHNAYGLDVQIISPPHTLLAAGTYLIATGALLLVVSWKNRTAGSAGTTLLFLFACATLLIKVMIFNTEYIYPNQQHTALFYKLACVNVPLWLIIAARASGLRWAATGTAMIYMLVTLAMIWILPLFPAQPGLAPIYNPVTHMVPPPFPLLLIVPAFGLDLVLQFLGRRRGFWRDSALSIILTLVFFGLLIAVQWPFSKFLLSPASQNWFFAGNAMWGYDVSLGNWCTEFWKNSEAPLTLKNVLISFLISVIVTRVALWFGNWVGAVKR